jgi:hypothetical protein
MSIKEKSWRKLSNKSSVLTCLFRRRRGDGQTPELRQRELKRNGRPHTYHRKNKIFLNEKIYYGTRVYQSTNYPKNGIDSAIYFSDKHEPSSAAQQNSSLGFSIFYRFGSSKYGYHS